MKLVLMAVLFLLAFPAVAWAQDVDASGSFDFNKLWQGALAGLMASVIRFWSQGKKPTEFDWRYLALYAGAGLLAGVYAAGRGLAWTDVFSWVEASGLVMVVYMALKGGKKNIVELLLRSGKKPPAAGDGSGGGDSG